MTLYSNDPRAIKLYHFLLTFFDEIQWGDENSDMVFEDNVFTFPKHKISLKTTDYFLTEIYDALSEHYTSRSPWGVLSGVRPLKIVHLEKEQGKTMEEIYHGLLSRDRLSEKKAKLLLEIAENQQNIYEEDRDQLSLYLSIPFCPSVCSYCSFHTRPYEKKLAQRYLQELLEDLHFAKEYLRKHKKTVDCIYVGGGTPWVLEEEDLRELLHALEDFHEIKEFTFEGGRIDVLTEGKADLVANVATRVCLNPQTLTKGVMPLLGRPETEDLSKWIRKFKDRGLITSSDLIAGLPGETVHGFQESLHELIGYAPDNITVHNLSLKKGAKLKQVEEGTEAAKMIDGAYEILKEAGYHPYYIYRQKNMVDLGENIGYEKGNTACLYNIRMMEDAHEILSLGSNAVSKRIIKGKVFRLPTTKDIHLHLENKEKRRRIVKDFFSV